MSDAHESPAGQIDAEAAASSTRRAGIVLCGGRSSRMGRAKALLPWFGRPMVEHVVGILRPVVDEVIVVGSPSLELPPLPARVVVDREPGGGPLAGLREGLGATEAGLAFVTSTDAPFLGAAFVESLFEIGHAAAPVAEGHVQVLCAVYPGAAAARADQLLREGVRRPLALLEAEGFKPIELGDEARPFPWRGFNTPAAYLAAAREVAPEATCELELLGRAALRAESTRWRLPIGTLGEVLSALPDTLGLIHEGRVAKAHLVSLGGRDLVRDLGLPVGPDERISVIDALAGG